MTVVLQQYQGLFMHPNSNPKLTLLKKSRFLRSIKRFFILISFFLVLFKGEMLTQVRLQLMSKCRTQYIILKTSDYFILVAGQFLETLQRVFFIKKKEKRKRKKRKVYMFILKKRRVHMYTYKKRDHIVRKKERKKVIRRGFFFRKSMFFGGWVFFLIF